MTRREAAAWCQKQVDLARAMGVREDARDALTLAADALELLTSGEDTEPFDTTIEGGPVAGHEGEDWYVAIHAKDDPYTPAGFYEYNTTREATVAKARARLAATLLGLK